MPYRIAGYSERFFRDTRKAVGPEREGLEKALRDLEKDPVPTSLRFHKLVGYENRYTFHCPGSQKKCSCEMVGENELWLRRYDSHDEIDKHP